MHPTDRGYIQVEAKRSRGLHPVSSDGYALGMISTWKRYSHVARHTYGSLDDGSPELYSVTNNAIQNAKPHYTALGFMQPAKAMPIK